MMRHAVRTTMVGSTDSDRGRHRSGTTSGTPIALFGDPIRIVYENHAHGFVHLFGHCRLAPGIAPSNLCPNTIKEVRQRDVARSLG